MIGVLIKRGNVEIDMLTRRILCENKGRDWGNASTSQEIPKDCQQSPRRKREGRILPIVLRNHGPIDIFYLSLDCVASTVCFKIPTVVLRHPVSGTFKDW